ncbi:uncharacterized protein LOC144361233 [Saccoglossus kowalevskii]
MGLETHDRVLVGNLRFRLFNNDQRLTGQRIQIVVKYDSQIKTKIVSNEDMQSMCKAVVGNRNLESVVKKLYKNTTMKCKLQKLVVKDLATQCQQLCSKKAPSLLRKTTPEDLLHINWKNLISEWKQRTPLLYDVLEAIAAKDYAQTKYDPEVHHAVIGFHGAGLLHERNQNMSRVHYAIGMLLDHGGTKNETISIMHKIGCSVTTTSIHNKKKQLVLKHADIHGEMFSKQVIQVEEKKADLPNILQRKECQ